MSRQPLFPHVNVTPEQVHALTRSARIEQSQVMLAALTALLRWRKPADSEVHKHEIAHSHAGCC